MKAISTYDIAMIFRVKCAWYNSVFITQMKYEIDEYLTDS